jgi:hypothetical protein
MVQKEITEDAMLKELPRNVKVTALIVILIIAGLLGYGIYKKVATSNDVAVTVATVPGDAIISIDGRLVTPGTVYLTPGKNYKVKVSKNGFDSYDEQKYIDATNNSITVALNPVSDSAKQWAESNQQLYTDLEAKAGAQANESGEAFTNKNPITNDLPIDTLIYTIGYKQDPADQSGNSIIITVDAAPGYRNGAIQAIKDLGYDPTQFKIEFKGYTNPFSL